MAHAVQRPRILRRGRHDHLCHRALHGTSAWIGDEPQCLVRSPLDTSAQAEPDGQACVPGEREDDEDEDDDDDLRRCVETRPQGSVYVCEHAGMLGTTSVGGGRVRYLGVLQDPNDLALATSLAVPFAFAFFEIRRSVLRLAMLLFTVSVVGAEVVLAKSRGGQVTFAAVLGAYYIKKYGWKGGAFVGTAVALPIAVLGGRFGDARARRWSASGARAPASRCSSPIPSSGWARAVHRSPRPHRAQRVHPRRGGARGPWHDPLRVHRLSLDQNPHRRAPPRHGRGRRGADREGARDGHAGGARRWGGGDLLPVMDVSYVLWIHFGLSGALYSMVRTRHPGVWSAASRSRRRGASCSATSPASPSGRLTQASGRME